MWLAVGFWVPIKCIAKSSLPDHFKKQINWEKDPFFLPEKLPLILTLFLKIQIHTDTNTCYTCSMYKLTLWASRRECFARLGRWGGATMLWSFRPCIPLVPLQTLLTIIPNFQQCQIMVYFNFERFGKDKFDISFIKGIWAWNISLRGYLHISRLLLMTIDVFQVIQLLFVVRVVRVANSVNSFQFRFQFSDFS